jgi:hypothetical protein
VQKSGAKDESSRSGTLTFNGTHASERGAAARKVEWGPALREFENFVGSRFTPACNTSRPGPAGLDRRPKEPPGARDGRRTAAGAAPAGRGTGLVPGCRHMLQTCYAITTLTTAAGLLTSAV